MTQEVYWRDRGRHLVQGRIYGKRQSTLSIQDNLVLSHLVKDKIESLKTDKDVPEEVMNGLKLLLWKLESNCSVEVVVKLIWSHSSMSNAFKTKRIYCITCGKNIPIGLWYFHKSKCV